MTGFTAILTETLPAGLLPRIAEGLHVSESLAGQTVTAYAIGSLAAAIPLTAATQGWRCKPTLLTAIVGFLLFNTITALSGNYWLTLGARFLAGVAAGLAWGILAGYARRMVIGPLKGKALAVAMVGTPIALSLGVPAGTFMGAIIGWRAAFLAMSATTIVLIGWVAWSVPDFSGQATHQRLSLGSVFKTPGIRPILATIFAWMTGHNILYTYVAPFAVLSGLQRHVDLLLLGFGLPSAAWCSMGICLPPRVPGWCMSSPRPYRSPSRITSSPRMRMLASAMSRRPCLGGRMSPRGANSTC
ncbi:MFS transporter [Acidomonas methanolica]|nr:MFS transporter [Acidomonas methanolica]